MSLKKRDPSLRVAANDPHLVSLGGGRLSTAVTIHYIPIGDMTIGSMINCNISLNGSGVLPLHCTLYRTENNEVMITPEPNARLLIDNNKITTEMNLRQGAMITIGNSNYLRFNNPAEAQLIRSVIGSQERISMPQIEFHHQNDDSHNDTASIHNNHVDMMSSYHEFWETKILCQKQQNTNTTTALNTTNTTDTLLEKLTNSGLINHSPKVFTADSITVNAPAKDVLGAKYASFAKNLAENHKHNKNEYLLNCNEMKIQNNTYLNIPAGTFIQNSSSLSSATPPPSSSSAATCGNNEVVTKVFNNNLSTRSNHTNNSLTAAYDRYPKPGSYGGLQLFPLNGINSEINTNHSNSFYDSHNNTQHNNNATSNLQHKNLSPQEQEIDEILKLCTEYDKQNQCTTTTTTTNNNKSITSSPIVQNRIKTNGSLPREKKSPFHQDLSPQIQINQNHSKTFFADKIKTNNSSGYENVRLLNDRRIEINGGSSNSSPLTTRKVSGYENVSKYIPQSPRTKIRTICNLSPKKEQNTHNNTTIPPNNQTLEYNQLIQSFEDKLKLEMQAIQEAAPASGKQRHENHNKKRPHLNINNLKLQIPLLTQSTQKHDDDDDNCAETPADDQLELNELKKERENVLANIRKLKTQIAEIQRQEDEVLRELDMEKALVCAESSTVQNLLMEMQKKMSTMQAKLHRLEAQRNADRVMQETQQSKLKQAIEMKQQQVTRIENFVENNPSDKLLKEELTNCIESLENDRKTFEDLEFQYLEEETDWLAYTEELHQEIKNLATDIDERQLQIHNLDAQTIQNQNIACNDTKTLENDLLFLLTALEKSREQLQLIEKKIFNISGQQNSHSDQSDDDEFIIKNPNPPKKVVDTNVACNNTTTKLSQSLYGSTDILCTNNKSPNINNLMSRSINENMLNHNIEILQPATTSTPKKQPIDHDTKRSLSSASQHNDDENDIQITPEIVSRENNHEIDPILKLKYNLNTNHKQENGKLLNLSLGSDDFEVNPLERRIPSQDDIDRICKIQSDAPITSLGAASSKIFESIKEIERNRQLLLAQQGSHVIQHERQKMLDLKKKCHDEARAQYLSSQSDHTNFQPKQPENTEKVTSKNDVNIISNSIEVDNTKSEKNDEKRFTTTITNSQQRYSHPNDLDSSDRPLSEATSELSYAHGSGKPFKSNTDLVSNSYHFTGSSDDARCSSVNSNDTNTSDMLISGSRRNLPKHQRPLTRYLPIISPYLDLKLHILSAGHQITLCPHVTIDSYSCRGYLHKLGSTFHTWSRRWFVFDRQRKAFIYYADKSEKKPRGGACFPTIDEVYLDHLNSSKSGRPSCTFIVKTKKRTYNLQAITDSTARIWIDVIITGAQGNTDYE